MKKRKEETLLPRERSTAWRVFDVSEVEISGSIIWRTSQRISLPDVPIGPSIGKAGYKGKLLSRLRYYSYNSPRIRASANHVTT